MKLLKDDSDSMDELTHSIQKVINGIAASNKPGHFLKAFKELFPLMDSWGLSAIPDCRIMPFVQAHIQESYIRTTISKMWPSEIDAIKRRVYELDPKWRGFCEAQTGNRKFVPYDVAGTEWPTLALPCPLLDEKNECAIGWRRPSGCLSENPNFLAICNQIDAKLLKKKDKLCLSLMDLLMSCCEDPFGSRILVLPTR